MAERSLKLEIRDMTKRYDNGDGVEHINLKIYEGEIVTMLGPSGCGKSTILRTIGGFLDVTDGDILIDNESIVKLPPEKRPTAMVFQSYNRWTHMTVYENLAFGLKLRKTPKEEIKRRVNEAARILGIEFLLNRKPKALSGGQRQRVALGRAIVREPKVFLMDEPLSNLDAKLRVQMRTEITKLHQRLQTTFIYVTHDQTEAMTMGSRIVIMKDGFIQQVDTPQNNYDYPANKFVAGFIGSPQMNFFDVELRKENGGVYAVFGDNKIKVPAEKLAKFKDESYIGKQVVMGIRPENLDDAPEYVAEHADAKFKVHVEVTELMGSETYLYLSTSGKEENVIARVDPRTATRNGDNIEVAMDTSRLHFFDKETEETILNR